jgi:hypothetical protein
MISITRKEIMNSKLLTNKAKIWGYQNMAYLNNVAKFKFFGTSTKMEKMDSGHKVKYELFVLYMQPADKVALKTICDMAVSSGCKKPCLISSGLLGKTAGQKAATKRTILFLLRPDFFKARITKEIAAKEKRAIRENVPVAFRLNGTSDIDHSKLIASNPNSQFWDYTKRLSMIRKNTLSNYHLTFSASMYSAQSKAALKKAVSRKYQIAAAFNTANTIGESFNIEAVKAAVSKPLVTFDDSDARFLDAIDVIGTLTRKGSNKTERQIEENKAASFFVTSANIADFNDIIASA